MAIKLEVLADVLLKGGKINTAPLEQAIRRAAKAIPSVKNVLAGAAPVTDKATTQIRGQLQSIISDADKFIDVMKGKGAEGLSSKNMFNAVADNAAKAGKTVGQVTKQVTGLRNTIDKLDSLFGAGIQRTGKFFTDKQFRKDLASVQKDPFAFLDLAPARQKKLQAFQSILQDTAKAFGDVRKAATGLSGQSPQFLAALGTEANLAKAAADNLKFVNNKDALEKKALANRAAAEKKFEEAKAKAILSDIKGEEKQRKSALNRLHSEALKLDRQRTKDILQRERKLDANRLAASQRRFAAESLVRAGGAGGIRGIPKTDVSAVRAGLQDIEKRSLAAQKNVIALRKDLERSGDTSSKKFVNTGIGIAKLGKSALDAREGINALDKRMSRFGSVVQQTGALFRQFARFAIGYGALFQVIRGITSLTRSIAGLEEQLKSVQAITQATDAEMRTIEATINQVALTTQFTTSEISTAARILGQAGVAASEFPTALASVAQFAGATQSSLELAADLLTTFRNVFSDLSDQTIADQLTKAVNISKLTAADLKTIASISAQTAKRYNISSEQYLAAAATLRDAGIKASTIATGFRRASNEIFSLDTRSIEAFKKRYAALNEEISEEAIKARFFAFTQADNPFVSALEELRRLGFSGSGKEEFARVFDIRAVNVISSAIDNLEKLKSAESAITFGSSAAEGAQTQLESLNKSLSNLGAAFTVFGSSVAGDGVGSLENFVDSATNALAILTEFNDELKATTGGGVGSAAAPAVLAGIGAFTLSKQALPARIGTSLAAGAAVGAGATGLESAGLTSTTESLTTLLSGVFIFDALKKVIGKIDGRVRAVVAKDLLSTGGKGALAGILKPLRKAVSNLFKILSKTVYGKVITGIVLAGTFILNLVKTQEDILSDLEGQLNQAQKNLQRKRAQVRSTIDVSEEFDVDRVGGPKKGTTADSIDKLVTEAEEVDDAVSQFFDVQAEQVADKRDQLEKFITAIGGDAGAANLTSELDKLGLGQDQAREAIVLGTKSSGNAAKTQQIATQILEQFRRVQDRVTREGGTEGLVDRDRNFFEAFNNLTKSTEGVGVLTDLKFPEQADIADLRESILALAKGVTDLSKKSVEDAQQSLEDAEKIREDQLIKLLSEVSKDDTARIEQILANDREVDATSSPEKILAEISRQTEVLDKVARTREESVTPATDRLIKTFTNAVNSFKEILSGLVNSALDKLGELGDFIGFTIDFYVDKLIGVVEFLVSKIPGVDSDFKFDRGGREAADVGRDILARDKAAIEKIAKETVEKRIAKAQAVLEKAAALSETDSGKLIIKELKKQGIKGAQELEKLLGLTAKQLTDPKNKQSLDFLSGLVSNIAQRASEDADKARDVTEKLLESQAALLQKRIDLASSTVGSGEDLSNLFNQQKEITLRLIEVQRARLTAEGNLTDAQINSTIAQERLSIALQAQADALSAQQLVDDKVRSNREKLEDIRNKGKSEGFVDLTKQQRISGRLTEARGLIGEGGEGNIQRAAKLAEQAQSIAQSLKGSFAAEFNFGEAAKVSNQAAQLLADIKKQKAIEETEIAAGESAKANDLKGLKALGIENATQALIDYKLKLKELNEAEINPKIDAGLDKVMLDLNTFTSSFLGLDGKTVTVTVLTKKAAKGFVSAPVDGSSSANPVKKRSGGTIPGSGTGDIVPAMLEPGEEVTKRSRAEEFRGVLKFINNAPVSEVRRAVAGIGQRFRKGGTVRGAGARSASGGTAGSGSPVYLQLPSGEDAGPLYGDQQAVAAMKKMLSNQVNKTTRRRR